MHHDLRSTPFRAALAGVLLLIASACTNQTPPDPDPTIDSVAIDPTFVELIVGENQAFSVDVTATGTIDTGVTWSVSDPDVADIDGDGVLAALSAGQVTVRATSVADPSKSASAALTVYETGSVRWAYQFGTGSNEGGFAVATDSAGNVVITGFTLGDLEGTGSSSGAEDVIVRKYDARGRYIWSTQFGTITNDFGYAVAVDPDDNFVIAGNTAGGMDGTNQGNFDVYLRKFDPEGNTLWTRQFGTPGIDTLEDMAIDSAGNIIVVGRTRGDLEGTNAGSDDAFVRKYRPNGDIAWTRQFGTSGTDFARAVAIDEDDGVVVAGYTSGVLAGSFNSGADDAYVRKFDSEGETLWTRQFGTVATDLVQSVAVSPSGLIVLAGNTGGSLSGASNGSMDMFIRTYHPNGDHDKTVQFGSSAYDSLNGVATDPSGNIFVTGYTGGALTGSNAGMNDAFLIKFLSNGTLDWTRQFGTEADDNSLGVATDASGMVYVTGHTRGDLVVTTAGQQDVFVQSYSR